MPQFYDALPTDYLAAGESITVSVDGFHQDLMVFETQMVDDVVQVKV